LEITNKVFIACRGAFLWLINFNQPFNVGAYIRDYSYAPENQSTEAEPKDTIVLSPNKCYTRISGFWLSAPKIHYYTFNWRKDMRVQQEVGKWKSLLNESMGNWTRDHGTVLIILHELSRSGAPILGIELSKRFKQSMNVIVISLKEGPLEEVLKDLGVPVYIIDWDNELLRTPLLELILDAGKVNCAVVNSICSYPVISVLKKRNIPIVSLVHEFASYIRERDIFPLIHEASIAVYYPAELVAEDAYRVHPELSKLNVKIMPQGLIKAPASINDELIAAEKLKIQEVFQGSEKRDICVILGVGSIEPRKGVDLFISAAQSMVRAGCPRPFRFVWIGSAISHFHRMDYQVHLCEQIRRAGLSEYVYIMDSVQNLQAAFKEADVFFLSSRLDPLPLVSLEAMEHALPLVCFDRASGIADYLKESTKTCSTVVPYLDIESAAKKIHELVTNPEDRRRIGLAQQELARNRFDMDDFTAKILSEFRTVLEN